MTKRIVCGAPLLAAALLVAATVPSFAAITCWYNPQGQYTGSDTAHGNQPLNQVVKFSGSGDYAYGYTIDAVNGMGCPRQMPR